MEKKLVNKTEKTQGKPVELDLEQLEKVSAARRYFGPVIMPPNFDGAAIF